MSVKTGKHYVGPAIGVAGLAFLLLLAGNRDLQGNETTLPGKTAFQKYIGDMVKQKLEEAFLPVFSFAENKSTGIWERFVTWQVSEIMPLYRMGQEEPAENRKTEDQMTIEMILLAEAEEGYGEAEQEEDAFTGNGMLNPDQTGEMLLDQDTLAALLQEENQAAQSMQQETQSENQAAQLLLEDFVPHTVKQAQVDINALTDYETLVKSFYTIDKSTMIGSDQLNVEKLSGEDMTISKTDPGPQILIYHTHSQEAFADSIPGDRATSIVGVGDHLAQILTEKYGYQVLHHDATYDVPSRDEAYSVALPDIEQVLAENPQIQVVIDLHRDAVAEETHLVTEIDGRPTARFMFFNGLSRTKKTGNITYLYNENLDSNLAFSFQLQKTALEFYPGLTRKIYLKAYRYNMHLRPRNLLVELGAQNNTVEEAMNACDPLAHILDMVLSGQE